jgi:hypothetical protein
MAIIASLFGSGDDGILRLGRDIVYSDMAGDCS